MVNILKEMLKAHFSFELKLKIFKMHQLHLNQTCLSVTVSPDAFIHKYDIWLKCYCIPGLGNIEKWIGPADDVIT